MIDRLKRDAVGLAGVGFMAVATAAPITAMTGNLPATITGGAIAAPSTHIVATVVF